MTDYSSWTDEELNEAIAVKKGWTLKTCACGKSCCHDWWMMPDGGVDYNQTDPPDYTHDWRLCGNLLEEMCTRGGIAKVKSLTQGWVWMVYAGTEENPIARTAPTPQRAICEAWLAWKELQ